MTQDTQGRRERDGRERGGRRATRQAGGRRAGNGAGTELKRGGCAMPSSSAPCQPASSQSSPAHECPPVKSKPPDLQKICEAEGERQAQGTTTRHRTRLTPSGRARRDSSGVERAERGQDDGRRDRASSCAVCNHRDMCRQLPDVLEIIIL